MLCRTLKLKHKYCINDEANDVSSSTLLVVQYLVFVEAMKPI